MKEIVKKQITAALKEPHHYVVALGLTLFACAIGELRVAVIGCFWLYALGENYSSEMDEWIKQRQEKHKIKLKEEEEK